MRWKIIAWFSHMITLLKNFKIIHQYISNHLKFWPIRSDHLIASNLVGLVRIWSVDPVYLLAGGEVTHVLDVVRGNVRVVVTTLPIFQWVAVGVGHPQIQSAVVRDEGCHADEWGAVTMVIMLFVLGTFM